MPIYDFRCWICDGEESKLLKIKDRYDAPICCDEKMKRVLSAPMINPNIIGGTRNPGYECVVSGKYVSTKKMRREIMSEYNLIEAGDMKPIRPGQKTISNSKY